MDETARPPGQWSTAQGRYRRAFSDIAEYEPVRPVAFRWWTVDEHVRGPTLLGAVVQGAVWAGRKVRGRRAGHPEGTHVALYDVTAPSGAEPFLVFEVRSDSFHGREGGGEGSVVGDPRPNGTLALLTEGRVVWPIYNPRVPYPDCPGR